MKSGNECTSDSKIGKYTPVILYVVVSKVTDVSGQPQLIAVLSSMCVSKNMYFYSNLDLCFIVLILW